jgi:hypothetical protein
MFSVIPSERGPADIFRITPHSTTRTPRLELNVTMPLNHIIMVYPELVLKSELESEPEPELVLKSELESELEPELVLVLVSLVKPEGL